MFRRLSLPPILEGDLHSELLSSPVAVTTNPNNPSSFITYQEKEEIQSMLSPTPPITSSPSSNQPSPVTVKINSPRLNNVIISSYKSPITKSLITPPPPLAISPCSITNTPLAAT